MQATVYEIGLSNRISPELVNFALNNRIKKTKNISIHSLSAPNLKRWVDKNDRSNTAVEKILDKLAVIFLNNQSALTFLPIQLSSRHMTLLVIAKKNNQYKAVYIDSLGNSLLHKESNVLLVNLVRDFCESFQKKLNLKKDNIELSEKIGEIFERGSDSAIIVNEYVVLAEECFNNNFERLNAEDIHKLFLQLDLDNEIVVIKKRYKFACHAQDILKKASLDNKKSTSSNSSVKVFLSDDLSNRLKKWGEKIDPALLSTQKKSRANYTIDCGKSKLDLEKLIVLMKESMIALKDCKDNDVFLVVGNTGVGKSVTINYLLESALKRVNNGASITLDHDINLQLIYNLDESEHAKMFANWLKTCQPGHVILTCDYKKGNPKKGEGWKLVMKVANPDITTHRLLTSKEISKFSLTELLDENDPEMLQEVIDQVDLDEIFHYLQETKFFDEYPQKFSPFIGKNYPKFKESTNSQTTSAEAYCDNLGNVIVDCAGFGDTRVAQLLDKGEITLKKNEDSTEQAIITTMSVRMGIEAAQSIKGLVLVISESEIPNRAKLLMNLIKDLLQSIPNLRYAQQIRDLADSMVVIITRIDTVEGDDKNLSRRKIVSFKRNLGIVKRDVKKDIEDQESNLKESLESDDGKAMLDALRDEIIPFFKKDDEDEFNDDRVIDTVVTEDLILVPDKAKLVMLEIIQSKITKKKIIFVNPSDDGTSRVEICDQMKLLTRTIPKTSFQFSGANIVHEKFIDGIMFVATDANELANEKDKTLPENLEILQSQKKSEQELYKARQNEIEVYENALNKGGLTGVDFDEMKKSIQGRIDIHVAALKALAARINKSKDRSAKFGKEKTALENSIIPMISQWNIAHADSRVESDKQGFFRGYAFNKSSTRKILHHFGHPYIKVTPTFHAPENDSYSWKQHYKVISDNAGNGKYEAKFDCGSWYDKHPLLTVSATIKKKYHPHTIARVVNLKNEILTLDTEIATLNKEINDANKKLSDAEISLSQNTAKVTRTTAHLKKELASARTESDYILSRISMFEVEISKVEALILENHSSIIKQYPLFSSIREIIELTTFPKEKLAVLNLFKNSFKSLEDFVKANAGDSVAEDRVSDSDDTQESSQKTSPLRKHSMYSQRKEHPQSIKVDEVRKLEKSFNHVLESNDVASSRELRGEIQNTLDNINDEKTHKLELKKTLQAEIDGLELKAQKLNEIKNKNEEFLKKTSEKVKLPM